MSGKNKAFYHHPEQSENIDWKSGENGLLPTTWCLPKLKWATSREEQTSPKQGPVGARLGATPINGDSLPIREWPCGHPYKRWTTFFVTVNWDPPAQIKTILLNTNEAAKQCSRYRRDLDMMNGSTFSMQKGTRHIFLMPSTVLPFDMGKRKHNKTHFPHLPLHTFRNNLGLILIQGNFIRTFK